MKVLCCVLALFLGGCAALGGKPSSGSEQDVCKEDREKMARVGEKIKGKIVWSSSRVGNHDIFIMNTDGSEKKALTKGEHVDWFPRFSPDGKTIMFCRSKKGWVYERDANMNFKWDVFTMDVAGGNQKKVAENACWGTWIGEKKIMFSRKTQVFVKDLESGEETLLVDSQKVEPLGGADLQQPQMSPDGKFLGITLRGAMRETGIFDLEKKTWVQTGEGCQINWHPAGGRIYWVNPSGNGGSEVFSVEVKDGKPVKDYDYEEMRFVDIPSRISHEYFPQMSIDAKWLVWAATQRGHDHDIADYEIHIWEIGTDPENCTRLTFHSGNDRWPDIFIPGAVKAQ